MTSLTRCNNAGKVSVCVFVCACARTPSNNLPFLPLHHPSFSQSISFSLSLHLTKRSAVCIITWLPRQGLKAFAPPPPLLLPHHPLLTPLPDLPLSSLWLSPLALFLYLLLTTKRPLTPPPLSLSNYHSFLLSLLLFSDGPQCVISSSADERPDWGLRFSDSQDVRRLLPHLFCFPTLCLSSPQAAAADGPRSTLPHLTTTVCPSWVARCCWATQCVYRACFCACVCVWFGSDDASVVLVLLVWCYSQCLCCLLFRFGVADVSFGKLTEPLETFYCFHINCFHWTDFLFVLKNEKVCFNNNCCLFKLNKSILRVLNARVFKNVFVSLMGIMLSV